MRQAILLLMLSLTIASIYAQTDKALSLRPNVVAISSQGQNGFGFVTGERFNVLFVVTAAHVVEGAVDADEPVEVKFYDDYKQYKGKVIRNFVTEDIALLEVPKPTYASWEKDCLGETRLGGDVAFVGREGDWYVPRGRALGTIYSLDNNEIRVDITSVTVGTSGAPLISTSGIVGMIVDTDGIKATAIDLDQLSNVLSEYDYFYQLTGNGSISVNPTDRHGNTYTTKVMKDGKRWMTQNLNLQVDDSWCYKNEADNCDTYGRLYTWEAAKEACAELGDGWRLPTDDEWQKLGMTYGGIRDCGGDCEDIEDPKASYQALMDGGSSGFAAQLGGYRDSNGSFGLAGTYGHYWSSSPSGSSDAWSYGFSRNLGKLYRDDYHRGSGRSVRCLQGSN